MMLKGQYPLLRNKEITMAIAESDGAKINTETANLSWNIKFLSLETKKFV